MNSTFLQRYEAGNSLLHKLDPRLKLIMVLCMIFGIVITPPDGWVAYPLLWTILGSLATIAGIGALRINRLAGLALPFALAAITLCFTVPGDPILQIAGLTVTDNGLARFIAIVLKSWLSMQAALVLALTTDFTDILWGLSGLRVPSTLIVTLSFMYRYLFTLKEETERLLQARAARSGTKDNTKAGGSILWRAKIAGGMVGNLFLRSYERSERVYAAMLARGYNGQLLQQKIPTLTRGMIIQVIIPIMLTIIIQIIVRL